jgi:hypothetical protein
MGIPDQVYGVLRAPTCVTTEVFLSVHSNCAAPDRFLSELSQGMYPSVNSLYVRCWMSNERIFDLVASPRSSIRSLYIIVGIIPPPFMTQFIVALSAPQCKIRLLYIDSLGYFRERYGPVIKHCIKAHKARDLLFMLAWRFPKNILWELSFFLI